MSRLARRHHRCTYADYVAVELTSSTKHEFIDGEITSDSSEEYDTGDKVEFYRTIPSLREYIIVSHRERRVTVHARGADGG